MWSNSFMRVALWGGISILLNACNTAVEEASVNDNPSVPAVVNAQPKDSEVVITWSTVTGAERYIVCWAYVEITDCDPLNPSIVRVDPTPSITETKWTHGGITNSTQYFYVVIAVLATGESAVSVNVVGTPEGIGSPTAISISTYDLTATVGWDKVAGATSYKVYRATKAGIVAGNPDSPPDVVSFNVPAGNLERLKYVIPNLSDMTPYYFIVTALKDMGGGENLESAESQEVIVIPKVVSDSLLGYIPTDLTITARYGVTVNGNMPEDYYDIDMSNPCSGTNSNQYQIHWSESPIITPPGNCGLASCYSDITLGKTYRLFGNNILPGVLYYFTAVNLTRGVCATSSALAPDADILSGVIGARTPGVQTPIQPVISTIPTPGLANSVTITVDQPVPGFTYDLYMVSQKFFDAGNVNFAVDNFALDAKWGMKHSDIPSTFIHRALPSDLLFYFIVTSVNSNGDESIASDAQMANPSIP